MYFQRALVVSTSVQGPSQRTAFFAALNTWSAACILLMQLFATSSLLRYLGMQVRLLLKVGLAVSTGVHRRVGWFSSLNDSYEGKL
jgi:ATP/ADP translocase